ncbi:MAG: Rieske 2Fe-2S domain-containing protein, partial [Gammaproteobacteria bacterium]|nr:Rieske 2Fe-2S domain-containing protein [Gammaproteobacteria bacterium]
GMKLLEGEGRRKTVVCPLHARTYGLDGRLIAAPRMETCAGFKRGDFNLIEFRLECSDGFAFVCLFHVKPLIFSGFHRSSGLFQAVMGWQG